jgi:Large polyvalent protein-associated domain 7
MDEQSPPRRSQGADREMSARPAGTGGTAAPSGAPTDGRREERTEYIEIARFTVELRAPDGQAVSRSTCGDAWRSVHEFSGLASQDLGRRLGVGASVQLTDRDGVYGAKLEVDDTGANQLKFDTDEGRALYKQVYRERQLALSQAPMSNRIEAMTPEAERPPSVRAVPRAQEQDEAPGQLRESVMERLQQRAEPETAEERHQLERDRQVVARASDVQLGLIATELAKDEPTLLRKVLNQVQREIETSVGQARSTADGRTPEPSRPQAKRPGGEPEKGKRPVHEDPPLSERFTAIEHTWRTDYWQRDRPDRLGFSETWLTLKTAEHSASVILGMVDRARERGWTKLHLDGSPEFKREAWILATARGLETSGYTATLGDREAVKAEQRRLSQSSPNRSQSAPVQDRAVQRDSDRVQPGVPQKERTAGPARDAQLNAAITKAMLDARVPAGLQARLREMITTDAQQRQTRSPPWRAQIYDMAAPKSRSAPDNTARTATRSRQQER